MLHLPAIFSVEIPGAVDLPLLAVVCVFGVHAAPKSTDVSNLELLLHSTCNFDDGANANQVCHSP